MRGRERENIEVECDRVVSNDGDDEITERRKREQREISSKKYTPIRNDIRR